MGGLLVGVFKLCADGHDGGSGGYLCMCCGGCEGDIGRDWNRSRMRIDRIRSLGILVQRRDRNLCRLFQVQVLPLVLKA